MLVMCKAAAVEWPVSLSTPPAASWFRQAVGQQKQKTTIRSFVAKSRATPVNRMASVFDVCSCSNRSQLL